ncbi:MAG: hypothetical protein RJA70_3520 [Pseudomonadota bacterium]|jgi:hypothetical protein
MTPDLKLNLPSDTPEQSIPRFDAAGRERPAFLLGFPADSELDTLVAAYERGDFLFVRENAARVINDATNEHVKRAANELRRRIDPDPLVVTMLSLAGALLLFLIVWAYQGAQ